MPPIRKWRVYCVTDNRWEFVWQVDAPTVCPIDADHTVRAQSISPLIKVNRVKSLTSNNSPYDADRHNFYVCDTSGGAITLNLSTAAGLNDGRVVYVLKTYASNTVTVAAAGAELIGGASTQVLSDAGALLKLVSSGADWTVLADDNTSYDATVATQATTAGTEEAWIFREIQSNSTNGGTNTQDTWETRTLNDTLSDYGQDVQRVGSEWILQQGRYHVHVECSFYQTSETRLRLRNVTDSQTCAVSLNAFVRGSPTISVTLDGVVNVAATPKTFRLEYYCQSQRKNTGLGRATGTGEDEVYTIVRIAKLA